LHRAQICNRRRDFFARNVERDAIADFYAQIARVELFEREPRSAAVAWLPPFAFYDLVAGR